MLAPPQTAPSLKPSAPVSRAAIFDLRPRLIQANYLRNQVKQVRASQRWQSLLKVEG